MVLWDFSVMPLKFLINVAWAIQRIPWATMTFVRFYCCWGLPGTILNT